MVQIISSIELFAYPFGILLLIGIIFFLERTLFLHKGQIRPENFLTGLQALLKKGRRMEAITLCEETPGSVARLMKIALIHASECPNFILDELRRNALLELPLLRKRIESLRFIAQLAPVIGLIGSVFYLLKGFWSLGTLQAYTSLTSFSPYITSALSITLIGFIEMFLFYLAYHFLKGRLRALIFDMEWAANEIVIFLSRIQQKSDESK